jgi:hypothetical protein
VELVTALSRGCETVFRGRGARRTDRSWARLGEEGGVSGILVVVVVVVVILYVGDCR